MRKSDRLYESIKGEHEKNGCWDSAKLRARDLIIDEMARLEKMRRRRILSAVLRLVAWLAILGALLCFVVGCSGDRALRNLDAALPDRLEVGYTYGTLDPDGDVFGIESPSSDLRAATVTLGWDLPSFSRR